MLIFLLIIKDHQIKLTFFSMGNLLGIPINYFIPYHPSFTNRTGTKSKRNIHGRPFFIQSLIDTFKMKNLVLKCNTCPQADFIQGPS